MERNCGDCKFYVFEYGLAEEMHVDESTKAGRCHRYPPIQGEVHEIEAQFPQVFEDVWCGEWQGKAEELK